MNSENIDEIERTYIFIDEHTINGYHVIRTIEIENTPFNIIGIYKIKPNIENRNEEIDGVNLGKYMELFRNTNGYINDFANKLLEEHFRTYTANMEDIYLLHNMASIRNYCHNNFNMELHDQFGIKLCYLTISISASY